MKRLSFASFAKVLVLCRKATVKQKFLVGTILRSVNENYDMIKDDSTISALVLGRKNLSDSVTKYLDKDPKKVSEYFRKNVVPLIDPNKQPSIVLTFQNIVQNDDNILDFVEIEPISKLTKSDFIETKEFVFADLLAGLFLYVAENVKNNNQEANVKEITGNYIESFDKDRNEISFVSPSEERESPLTNMPNARLLRLSVEQEGKCPHCGKTIVPEKCTIINLGENEEMIFCLECAVDIQKSEAKKAKFLEEKKQSIRYCEVRDTVAEQHLPGYIQELIEFIAKNSNTSNSKINMSPKKIEQKVSDPLLKCKVKSYVLEGMYELVNNAIMRLSEENKIHVDNFRKSVRRMYEDANDSPLSQSKVFSLLVERLNDASGRKSLEACEAVVSYFVQSCEVFNEIAK